MKDKRSNPRPARPEAEADGIIEGRNAVTEALRAGLQTALDSGLTGADIRQICADYLKESEEKA